MISTGSRAAATAIILDILVGCEQGGRDDGAELADGPSTIEGGDSTGDESGTSDTDSSDGSADESGSTDSSDTGGDSTSDTGVPDLCPAGTVSITADFYDSGNLVLSQRVFDECLSLSTFGSVEGFTLSGEFSDDVGLYVALPATTAVGDSAVQGDGNVVFNLDVKSNVPPAWVGDYWLVSGDLSVAAIGFTADDPVSLVFTGTLYGPDNYFVDVTITADVVVMYE